MRQKQRVKAVKCRKLGTGETRVFKSTDEAAEFLGLTRQAVSRGIQRGSVVAHKWVLTWVPKIFAVKNDKGIVRVCRYNVNRKRYEDVSGEWYVLNEYVEGAWDITADILDRDGMEVGF